MVQLEIKVPQELGENEPHLGVRELASDAVARADAEGLRRVVPVGGKDRIGAGKPSFRQELVCPVEVARRSAGRVQLESDRGL